MRCAQFQQVRAPQPRPCRPILLRCLANGGWCPGLECHDQARPTNNPQTIERISFSGLCTRLERLERLAFWGWFWYVTGAAQVLCANAPIGCIPCSNEYLVGQTNLPNAHGAAKLHRFSRKPKTGSLETPPPPPCTAPTEMGPEMLVILRFAKTDNMLFLGSHNTSHATQTGWDEPNATYAIHPDLAVKWQAAQSHESIGIGWPRRSGPRSGENRSTNNNAKGNRKEIVCGWELMCFRCTNGATAKRVHKGT